jgi:lipopolysaccharide/colanic/teichoic acid biosynthesis glycosyltransferase
MLAIAAAIRFTSRGPALFLQERVGHQGRKFTIFKFRTMTHAASDAPHPITTSDNQRCTVIGPFLRRWKLDEVPQLINVLLGHMSLVGPRPKLREFVAFDLPCRPGITGMATIAFAREQLILARLPKEHLETYIHSAILPAKQRLDSDYMARATFLSDLRLIFNTLLHRWDTEAVKSLLDVANVIDSMQRRGRASELDLKLMELQLAIGQRPAGPRRLVNS